MGYAVKNDGSGWRAVGSKNDCTADEVFSENQPESIQVDLRLLEIKSRLNIIDIETLRPLRAVWAGTSTDADHEKLTALENEAAQLREELNAN